MKCERCDEEVAHDGEHYNDVRYDDGMPVWECSGWTCTAIDWRQRFFDSEERHARRRAWWVLLGRNLWAAGVLHMANRGGYGLLKYAEPQRSDMRTSILVALKETT